MTYKEWLDKEFTGPWGSPNDYFDSLLEDGHIQSSVALLMYLEDAFEAGGMSQEDV